MPENCLSYFCSQLADLCTSEEGVGVVGVKEGEVDRTGGTKVRQLQGGVGEELLGEHGLLLANGDGPVLRAEVALLALTWRLGAAVCSVLKVEM